ncbi:MAG: pyrroline-5-carboxylate reductase [Pseudomonadota bacterium]
MASPRIALIGAGRMGEALATGWLSARSKPQINIVDPEPSDLILAMVEDNAARLGLNQAPEATDIVVVAVKPQIFAEAAENIQAWIGPDTLVLSIMAGIRLKALAASLGTTRIIRAMPNTPGAIGAGITALCAPEDCLKKDLTLANRLLTPLGRVVGPISEALFSSVTAVSGSGPAYVFMLVEALAGAAEGEGIAPDLAETLARETIIGAAALLEDSGESAAALRKAVASKGGVTEAALDILMRGDGMPSLMREAVRAAAARERALSAGS